MIGPWVTDGACRAEDPEMFFPVLDVTRFGTDRDAAMAQYSARIAAAKAVCRRCPVCAQCAAWALQHDEAGIWGGLSEEDRRDLRMVAV